MTVTPQTRFVLFLEEGAPKNPATLAEAIVTARTGLVIGEALQALKQGQGWFDVRLDADRASRVQEVLQRGGVVSTVVEATEAVQKVPVRLVNDLVIDALHFEGVDGLSKNVTLAWSDLVGVCAGKVKSVAMRHLDESTSTEITTQRVLRTALDQHLLGRTHDPVADRAERAEARDAATAPEPYLDLFFRAPLLTWIRVPLLRLRFSGEGLAPTARKNLERWLTHLHAGATQARYEGEVKPKMTRLEPEQWPTLEPHLYERFARWMTYRSRNR